MKLNLMIKLLFFSIIHLFSFINKKKITNWNTPIHKLIYKNSKNIYLRKNTIKISSNRSIKKNDKISDDIYPLH